MNEETKLDAVLHPEEMMMKRQAADQNPTILCSRCSKPSDVLLLHEHAPGRAVNVCRECRDELNAIRELATDKPAEEKHKYLVCPDCFASLSFGFNINLSDIHSDYKRCSECDTGNVSGWRCEYHGKVFPEGVDCPKCAAVLQQPALGESVSVQTCPRCNCAMAPRSEDDGMLVCVTPGCAVELSEDTSKEALLSALGISNPGNEILAKLHEAGVVSAYATRVIVDIHVDEPVRIYETRYADDRAIEVLMGGPVIAALTHSKTVKTQCNGNE